MRLLRGSTMHLRRDLLPDLPAIANNRTVNYLSFYLSYNGHHLYYAPRLTAHDRLQAIFAPPRPNTTTPPDRNNEHVLAKMLLAGSFQEHVVDQAGTVRLMGDLQALSSIDGSDIADMFFRGKCKRTRAGEPFQLEEKPLPAEKRRNFYVCHPQTLPAIEQLTRLITLNPFYRLPNLNKVLVFGALPNQPLQLTTSLEGFCHHNSVKIKLFERPSTQTVLEYIYTKTRGKILIHENINYDKEIYDLETPAPQQRVVNGKVLNPLNTHIMPQEVVLLTQRLPEQSLATERTKDRLLSQMRQLLGLEEGEELIDPVRRIAITNIEKNYRFEEYTRAKESSHGFLLRRYLTEEMLAFRRKSSINTPFTNPAR